MEDMAPHMVATVTAVTPATTKALFDNRRSYLALFPFGQTQYFAENAE